MSLTLVSLAALSLWTLNKEVAAPTPPVDALALARQDEAPKWKGSLDVGASQTVGNSDLSNFSVGFKTTRETEQDRIGFHLQWNYASKDRLEDVTGDGGSVLQRKLKGDVQYDYFLSEQSYVLANLAGTHDFKAEIELRVTGGLGYGYQFRDDDEWKVSAEAGLSYFDEEFFDGTETDYLAARFAYDVLWTYSERWEFGHTGEILPALESRDDDPAKNEVGGDEENYDVTASMVTHARANLTESMFGQFQWILDWDHTPSVGNRQADHLFLLSVGWSY